MGDRVTRTPESREIVRAKRLRKALERRVAPAFIPPDVDNSVAQASNLSWSLSDGAIGADR